MQYQNLSKRLYISKEDLIMAGQFSEFILKKKLHYSPWERRGSIYLQQSAFTSSLIIFYSRPFTKSIGLPDFPKQLLNLNKTEIQLHTKIIELHHKVYAHSDDSSYRVKPVFFENETYTIIGAPFFKLSKVEVIRIQRMIGKIINEIENEIKNLISNFKK